MTQKMIKCPKCGEAIELSQAISQDIEKELKQKHEREITTIKETAAQEINKKESEAKLGWAKEKASIIKRAKEEAEATQQLEATDLKAQLEEKTKRLKNAEQLELDLRKKQRALEEKGKTIELELTRKLDSEREKIFEDASKQIEDGHRLKNAEKDKQLDGLKRQIEDLRRKAAQASQKMQGEVLEVELEEMLSQDFPFDLIESVAPGVRGGDIIHTINTQSGKCCGKILWETKRTKTWSDRWIQKVKDDQRNAKADISVIVSEVLPSGFHHFRQIEGVWVTDIPSVSSLALALRLVLMKAATERRMQAGKGEKMEIVYSYLTGFEFKNRIEAIVEAFISMKCDLEKEKAAAQRQWAKREKNIERVIANTVGMHGDLEGIAGASLPSIKILEPPSEEPELETAEKKNEKK